MYLTPARLATMRLGASLDGIPDIELASILEDAAAITDAHCNVPLTPYPYTFLGATIVDEELPWPYPQNAYQRLANRIYPKHWPVRSVTSLTIKVGANAAATIPPDEIVINNKERWVEITALSFVTGSGLFGVTGWIVPIGGLKVPVALLTYESGFSLPVSDERLWPVAEGSKTYQGSFGWWIASSESTPIVVTDGVTVLTAGDDYTIGHDDGRITLDAGYTPVGEIRASYWHKLPREIERAQGFIAADLLGDSKLRAKGFTGLAHIRVGEIEMTRPTMVAGSVMDLEHTVPDAALLLGGYRFWSIA